MLPDVEMEGLAGPLLCWVIPSPRDPEPFVEGSIASTGAWRAILFKANGKWRANFDTQCSWKEEGEANKIARSSCFATSDKLSFPRFSASRTSYNLIVGASFCSSAILPNPMKSGKLHLSIGIQAPHLQIYHRVRTTPYSVGKVSPGHSNRFQPVV